MNSEKDEKKKTVKVCTKPGNPSCPLWTFKYSRFFFNLFWWDTLSWNTASVSVMKKVWKTLHWYCTPICIIFHVLRFKLSSSPHSVINVNKTVIPLIRKANKGVEVLNKILLFTKVDFSIPIVYTLVNIYTWTCSRERLLFRPFSGNDRSIIAWLKDL